MTIIKMDMDELVQHQRRLGVDYLPAVKRGLLAGSLRGVVLLQEATRRAGPANPNGEGSGGAVNTGAFLRAWKATPLEDGALLLNDSPYGAIVEEGRRPGRQPPIEPIARWIQRRRGVGYETAKKIAFVVARAIGKRGLLPRRIMAGSLPEILRYVQEEVGNELDKVDNA